MWQIEQSAGGTIRLHDTDSGTVSYRDKRGRPYSVATAKREAERYANAGRPKPAKREKCPKCGGTLNRPNAMLPCTCDRSEAAR